MSIQSIILSLKSVEHNLSHSSIKTLREFLKTVENNITIHQINELNLPYHIYVESKTGVILNDSQTEHFKIFSRMQPGYYYQTYKVEFQPNQPMFNSNLLDFNFATIRRDSLTSSSSFESSISNDVIDLSLPPPSSVISEQFSERDSSFELYVRFQSSLDLDVQSENFNLYLHHDNHFTEFVHCNITKSSKKSKSIELSTERMAIIL